jgi:hypothetical protein
MRRGVAEENFTLASTGATWGEGLRASFVDAPKFEDKTGVKVTQEFAIDSVFTAKAMASCGSPPFSSLAVLHAEANFLALGGSLELWIGSTPRAAFGRRSLLVRRANATPTPMIAQQAGVEVGGFMARIMPSSPKNPRTRLVQAKADFASGCPEKRT